MKVYLSSTYTDLQPFREKVYASLRKLRHDVVSMEDYVAGDQRPLAKCLADVAEADVYVGLFAWRYGYVPRKDNPDGLSITELEFRHAREIDKPCLIFLLRDDAPWVPTDMDAVTGDGDGGAAIRRLRGWFQEELMVSFFATPDQAANEVVIALSHVTFDENLRKSEELAVAADADRAPRAHGRAAARDGYPKLWRPGDLLRVRFLDGDAALHDLVEEAAREWLEHANLAFEFGDDPEAEVRVKFAGSGSSWSFVGTDALVTPATEPTMDLGLVGQMGPAGRHAAIHEFGHVLGLLHEHQNPERPDIWDEAAVYRAYAAPPNNWTREQVDKVVLATWEPGTFPVDKPFDPDSIMIFPIPNTYTKGDFEIGWNTQISAGDAEFVGKLYP